MSLFPVPLHIGFSLKVIIGKLTLNINFHIKLFLIFIDECVENFQDGLFVGSISNLIDGLVQEVKSLLEIANANIFINPIPVLNFTLNSWASAQIQVVICIEKIIEYLHEENAVRKFSSEIVDQSLILLP